MRNLVIRHKGIAPDYMDECNRAIFNNVKIELIREYNDWINRHYPYGTDYRYYYNFVTWLSTLPTSKHGLEVGKTVYYIDKLNNISNGVVKHIDNREIVVKGNSALEIISADSIIDMSEADLIEFKKFTEFVSTVVHIHTLDTLSIFQYIKRGNCDVV